MEVWQHDASSTHPEWTQQLVNDAMNMVQWQNVEDDIVTGPRPLGNQTLDLEDEGGDRKKRKPQKVKGISKLWSNDTFDCCLPGTEENVLVHTVIFSKSKFTVCFFTLFNFLHYLTRRSVLLKYTGKSSLMI